MPSLPVAFSSRLRGGSARGRLLVSNNYYVVFETKPIMVMQMAGVMAERRLTPNPLEYLYTAAVFYRKSKNPHGPSSRPIYVFCLEYTEFTCEMKPRGLWGSLTGEPKEPAEVFSAIFFEGGRSNMGKVRNHFTDQSALEFLMNNVCERLNIRRSEFTTLGTIELGPDCAQIA